MHFKNRHFFKLSCAKTLLNVGVIGALSLGGARSAMAVILTPGSSGTPDGSISLAGDQFVSSTSSSYTGSENIQGVGAVSYDFIVATSVYSRPSNGNQLDFVYQLTNTGPVAESDSFERITVSDFTGFSVNADYLPNTGSTSYQAGPSASADIAPTGVDSVQATGSTIGFQFNQNSSNGAVVPISAQEATDELVVRTDSMTYTMGTGTVIDGLSESVQISAPMAEVGTHIPEPGTLGLLSAATIGYLVRRRRAN
jgi:hypothetical protein